MNKKLIIIISLLSLFPILPIFAENYNFQIDEHSYDITYNIDTGNILAMELDQELISLLIGTENVNEDSIFSVKLPSEMISAENNAFAILVNGIEVDYDISSTDANSEFTFLIPAFTEEIEIIGTHVIPEFPFGILTIFSIIISFTVIFSRNKLFR